MQQAIVDINSVKTKLLLWGGTLQEIQRRSKDEDVIVMITGNPGLTRFYTVFLQTLHERTKRPVIVLGHAGHEPRMDGPPLKGNEAIYGLQGQVDHKINFIKTYLTDANHLHLIGHSIGCYVILKLLKDETIKGKIIHSYLLFPTIEYMSDTDNGRFMTRIVKHVAWLLVFLSWIFTLLPAMIENFLVYVFIKIKGIPKMHLKTIVSFVNPSVLEQVFFMAYEEMDYVKERDNQAIKDNLDKLTFYYGASDGWVPVKYYENLKQDFPNAKAELCVRNFEHSFVLNNSRDVGNMVADWIIT